MKKHLFYLLICLPFCVSAQLAFDPTGQINQFASQLASRTGNLPIFDLRYDNIKGSQFVIDDYCDGSVWMTKNRKYTEGYQFKYDETQNVVRAKNLKTGVELELLKEEVLALKLDYQGQFIMFITADVPNSFNDERCLMQVIYHSPNYCLLKRPSKSLEKVKGEPLTQQESYSMYKSNPDYYFRNKDKPYEKIKLSKKAFIAQFDNKKSELEKLFDSPDYKGILTDWKVAKILQAVDNQ
jgi:hypothetical protein